MKTEFKKSKTNFGCYIKQDNAQDKYLPNEDFTIDDILNADVRLKDKAWFILNNCKLNVNEKRVFAIGCAWVVLPIFEEKYPNDKRPRKAIKAAQYYLDGKISLEELEKARDVAVYAARTYADADDADAYAAYTAAYAAVVDVDVSVVDIDVSVVDIAVAVAAAYAAVAVAADASEKYEILLLQYLKDFTFNK